MTTLQSRDYIAQGLDKLLHQFRGKPNIEAVLSSYMGELNEAQEVILNLLGSRGVDTATGSFLDEIGALVSVPRAGLLDEEYRTNIRVGILLDISEGTPSDLIEIVKILTDSASVDYFEHHPATVHMTVDGQRNLHGLYKISKSSVPVGVEVVVAVQPEGDTGLTLAESTLDTFSLEVMVDELGNNIVDNLGQNILVSVPQGLYKSLSILPELPQYGGTPGKPLVEIYDINR